MKLNHLKDQELEFSFHRLVKTERRIIHLVLLHVQEVSRRKLHLARGYSSLFEYLIKELKYSASAAQRRIEAAKLMNEVPAIADKIQSGAINLSQIGELQKAVKSAEKVHQVKVASETKAELIDHLLNKNLTQTQQLCAEALEIPIVESQKITTQKDHSRRVEVTFTKEQYAKYEKLKDQLAHKNFQNSRSQDMNDVLETMFDELLLVKSPKASPQTNGKSAKRKSESAVKSKADTQATSAIDAMTLKAQMTDCKTGTVMRKAEAEAEAELEAEVNHVRTEVRKAETNCTKVAATKPEHWKSLTPKRKKIILEMDSCCQYIDYETGRLCGSTFNLHVDHIQPKWAGGSNDPGNLRVLCREHNLYRGRIHSSEIQSHNCGDSQGHIQKYC